uniref:Probable xyloglucan endotransglucosylase/hydrolase protein 30 n=1 Tax=Tanacetum cinerariifolium TaxID=118510 RepID=A0A6L2J4K5_TANCI|nr:probable xyloglucan endotransglucosylase/hydrolase protein 30 [Tanacetum cinerariifolium]
MPKDVYGSISLKITVTAICQFAYGSTADAFDEYLQMSEHTARDALFFFKMCIIKMYMSKYLRKPTSEDVVNIQQKHNNVHGFLRLLGTGANNDINVLDNSSLFDDLLDDLAPAVSYVVNGVEYRNGVKKVHEKMSNKLSVSSKDVGDLFNNRPVHTKLTHYVESCVEGEDVGRDEASMSKGGAIVGPGGAGDIPEKQKSGGIKEVSGWWCRCGGEVVVSLWSCRCGRFRGGEVLWCATTSLPRIVSFENGFTQLFGGDTNLLHSDDDYTVHLHLNQYTGAGFRSSDLYNHGLFSAKIKLPSDYTARIVVAFYTSNGDVFQKTHDELDFEFLGNIKGKPWRFQTNLYSNGSTSRGREERYTFWFDPTKAYHRYTILWTSSKIIFYIDEVPIREILRSDEMGSDFPSKPMALYATIWDASNWATNGGKYKEKEIWWCDGSGRDYEVVMVVVGECGEGSWVHWWRRVEKVVVERRMCRNEMEQGLAHRPMIVGVSHDLRGDSWGCVPRSLFWRKDLDRDGERRFDYLTFALVSSKASAKGVGLRVVDSHTGKIITILFVIMNAKDSITTQTCELSQVDFNDFLALYPIPSKYHVILPKSNQTIFDAPLGLNPFGYDKLPTFVVMCKAYGCEPSLDLFRGFFNLCRAGKWLMFAKRPILFLAGLKPSWEHGQQQPAIMAGRKEMAFRNFIYTKDDDDLDFLPKEPSLGFGIGSPSTSVNTEPPKDVEEPEVQPVKVTADSEESPKAGVFVVHLGSVATRIKERKCKTRGGSLRPLVKRKLASGPLSSRAMRAKTFAFKDVASFLSISNNDEGLPDCFELKDANACHLKISAITLPAWKGHLGNQIDLELLDLHDRYYTERSREEEYEGLRVKCKVVMAEFDQNPVVLALREKISSLTADVTKHKEADKARLEAVEVSLHREVEELKQDRRDVVSMVIPYAVIELVHSNELGRFVGKLVSSAITYRRCRASEQVAAIKEPFELSKVKGYRSSYQKDHTQASNDFTTAMFPWLDEFVADATVLIKTMLLKNPPMLQKPAPSRNQ